MKKIWKALVFVTLGVFTFSSCEDVPAPYPIPDNNQGNTSDNTYINETFASSLGSFTSHALSGDLAWKNDYSSAMITGFQDFDGDGTKENKEGVTLLVSPSFSLAASQAAYVTFNHAINYSKTSIAEDHKLLISKNYTGNAQTATWEELPIKTDNTGSSFDFVNVGQIAIPAAYIGQKNIFIALKHIAHEDYSSTWKVRNFKVLEGEPGGNEPEIPDTPVEPGDNLLVYGGFESWTGSTPNGWKTASTAGNATLSKSTDAKSGSYSVEVGGGTANKRLGSTEMTLAAGTYTFSVSVKAATAGGGSFSLGYVPVVDGKVGTYTYHKENGKQVYYNDLSQTQWTNASYTFTLTQPTTLSLLVMNSKNPGKNILVDDASLTSADGGIVK